MAKRIDHEGPIHRACIAYLEAALPGAVVFHPSNELPIRGGNAAKVLAKAKMNGTTPGYPDIICHWMGMTMLFEVKAEGGYLSPAQRAMKERLEAQAIPYAVVRGIEDVKDALADFEHMSAVPFRGVVK